MDELMGVDHVVIASPMYNYSIPAALKAWIDMAARANETFRYVFDDGDPYVDCDDYDCSRNPDVTVCN